MAPEGGGGEIQTMQMSEVEQPMDEDGLEDDKVAATS